jgi:hypothetical protein
MALKPNVANALDCIANVYGWETAIKLWSDTCGFNATNLDEIIERVLTQNNYIPRVDLTESFKILTEFDDFYEEVPKFFKSKAKKHPIVSRDTHNKEYSLHGVSTEAEHLRLMEIVEKNGQAVKEWDNYD